MFEIQQTRLLATLDDTHEKYCRAEELDWPSLYFHLKSIESGCAGDFERFAENAYAMLVAWKMQRTGGGPRMSRFEEFKSSLRDEILPNARIVKLKPVYRANWEHCSRMTRNTSRSASTEGCSRPTLRMAWYA
jgi:hypothetical protein